MVTFTLKGQNIVTVDTIGSRNQRAECKRNGQELNSEQLEM